MKEKYSIIIEKENEDYLAYMPNFKYCFSRGETLDDVISNIKDVIKLNFENEDFVIENIKEVS